MGQIEKKHRINSHLIIHCATGEMCERTSKWTSEWPSTAVWIPDYSGPTWGEQINASRRDSVHVNHVFVVRDFAIFRCVRLYVRMFVR